MARFCTFAIDSSFLNFRIRLHKGRYRFGWIDSRCHNVTQLFRLIIVSKHQMVVNNMSSETVTVPWWLSKAVWVKRMHTAVLFHSSFSQEQREIEMVSGCCIFLSRATLHYYFDCSLGTYGHWKSRITWNSMAIQCLLGCKMIKFNARNMLNKSESAVSQCLCFKELGLPCFFRAYMWLLSIIAGLVIAKKSSRGICARTLECCISSKHTPFTKEVWGKGSRQIRGH